MSDSEKKPIGYTVGPAYKEAQDYSKPQPVHELSPEDAERARQLAETAQQLKDTRAALATLEARFEMLRQPCKHPVFKDIDGWLYHERFCIVCGANIDSI